MNINKIEVIHQLKIAISTSLSPVQTTKEIVKKLNDNKKNQDLAKTRVLDLR